MRTCPNCHDLTLFAGGVCGVCGYKLPAQGEKKVAKPTADELNALAQAVAAACAALQDAIYRAHEAGLETKIHVELIGDCTSTRQRPDLFVMVSQPLSVGFPSERRPSASRRT